ncbi:MAG: DUF916 and DUF3324 domain-containing protein [Enterococcus sp.]
MNKRSPLRWLFVAISLFLFSPVFVNAEEANLNFYVTPEFPESQLEGSEQYFNLNAEPGSTEKLSLKLQNADDKTKAILITPHTAFTNVMGVVEYGKDAEEADPTLPYSLAELMETPEPIELAGNETKIVEIPLTLPKEAFEGFLAGGLRISEVREEKEEEATDEEGVAIKNEFAYVVGVVVSNSRSSVQPDLELLDVFADQLNYRNVISANLQNFTPTFVNRLKVEATVQKEGEKAILYQASQEQMQMAPNSNFNFPISLAGDRFQSGDYVLKLKATSGEEEWEWERTFTIEADEARRLNRQDVTIDSSVNWWMVGSLILLFLLAVVLSYIFYRKNRENKKNNQNME